MVSFPQVSPPKSCMHLSCSPCVPHASPIIPDLLTRIIFVEECRSPNSPICSLLHPLRPKYSPQRPILKHPQPMFLPQWERPSFIPIQNSRQYYSIFVFIFLDSKNSAPNGSKLLLLLCMNGIFICQGCSQICNTAATWNIRIILL